jgi:hypothetical protein
MHNVKPTKDQMLSTEWVKKWLLYLLIEVKKRAR